MKNALIKTLCLVSAILDTKLLILLAFLTIKPGCSLAQLTNLPTKPWNATITIVGEHGEPVVGASVAVAYVLPPYSFSDDPQFNEHVLKTTDTNGVAFVEHNDRSYGIGFIANKAGYYETRSARNLRDPMENADDRNISVKLMIKKIGTPIAMYAKRLNTHVPDLDKPVGYDLELGDWVGPYGKGIKTDINFTGHFDKFADGGSDFTLTVSFPKDGDGILEFAVPESEKGSGLRSPHEAPADGYLSQWIQTDKRKPSKPIETNRDENRNYFFRVRTVKNSEGKIVSAHYGKIYGDFMQFTYYLNPTPNDRNIEFDLKQNLLQGSDDSLKVSAP